MSVTFKNAYIEITNLCNLNCRTCYNRSGKNQVRMGLSLSQFQSITNRLISEFGCTFITLAGGEPTLHAEFLEFLEYLLTFPNLRVGIVTNGTTNCQTLINLYRLHPQIKIQVSLDGSCENSNAKTRGSGHFRQTISFIEAIKGTDRLPVMRMVVSKNNLLDVEPFYRLAMSMECMPDFAFINEMGNARDNWESLALTDQQKLSVLRTVDRLNEKFQMAAYLPLCISSCPFTNIDASLSVLVKNDGTVQPCHILYSDAYSLGNLLLDSTESIAERYSSLSKLAKKRAIKKEACSKCLVRETCNRGCIGYAVIKNRDPLGDDGECTFRKIQLLYVAARKFISSATSE